MANIKQYRACWHALVQAERQSNGDVQVVHQVMANHLDCLNENLIPVMKELVEEALTKYPHESKKGAIVVGYISLCFWKFPLGSRGDNMEIAIAGYKIVLPIYTKENDPEGWATTMNNLATAYKDRIKGDRAENIEEAIAAYKEVLTVKTKTDFLVDWATIMNNLALAYKDRKKGNKADNIEEAIAVYKEVLTVTTKTNCPKKWATIMNNLALAYKDREKGNKADNIEEAIKACEKALTVTTKIVFPEDWATIMNNLALAYKDRRKGNKAENIEKAIAAYKEALTVKTETAFPVDWAIIMSNLAAAYWARIKGDKAENIEEAIVAYKDALTILHPDKLPNECRLTAWSLGNLYSDNQRWTKATESYTLAIRAAENLYSASLFLSSKEAELKETDNLYRRAAYAYGKTDNLQKAIATLEQGRARGLRETLQRDRTNLEGVKNINEGLFQRYQTAAMAISQLESEERNNFNVDSGSKQLTPGELRQQAIRYRKKLEDCIAEVRQVEGYENFLKLPTFEEIVEWTPANNPLVYLLVTPLGGAALVLEKGETGSEETTTSHATWLENLTEKSLVELLPSWSNANNECKEAYFQYKDNQDNSQTKQQLHQAKEKWLQVIDDTTRQLWTLVMKPVVHYLEGHKFTQAILIPTGYLSLLPLHSAWTNNPDTPTKRSYALDNIRFTYTPNAVSLQAAQTIAQQTPVTNLLAVENPTGDLRYSTREVAAATATFEDHTI